MSDIREPNDIREGEWVLDENGSVFQSDCDSTSDFYFRILTIDELKLVQPGTVLYWVVPGSEYHMEEVEVWCGGVVLSGYSRHNLNGPRAGAFLFALKSLPAAKLDPKRVALLERIAVMERELAKLKASVES